MGLLGNIFGQSTASKRLYTSADNATGSFILDRIGRRPLIIFGFAGCLVTLCIEAALVARYASPVPEVEPNMPAIRAAVAML